MPRNRTLENLALSKLGDNIDDMKLEVKSCKIQIRISNAVVKDPAVAYIGSHKKRRGYNEEYSSAGGEESSESEEDSCVSSVDSELEGDNDAVFETASAGDADDGELSNNSLGGFVDDQALPGYVVPRHLCFA